MSTAPLWGFVNSGTTWLTQTGYAWGGYSRLYPTVKRERVDDVLLRLETLVEATLASPETRSRGMLDLGLTTTATVPSIADAKLCGACGRSPFARSVRLKRPGVDG